MRSEPQPWVERT